MNFSSTEVYRCLINELEFKQVKYTVHEFASENKMVDIWYKNLFFVVQIESDFAGISIVNNDDPGFDLAPNLKFSTTKDFLSQLHLIVAK